jgi:PAS domain-containing protein
MLLDPLLVNAIGTSAAALGASALIVVIIALKRRKRSTAKDAQMRENVLLRHAIGHAGQGIAVFDNDEQLIVCNDAFRFLYGFESEEVVVGVTRATLRALSVERGARLLRSKVQDEGSFMVEMPRAGLIQVRFHAAAAGGLVEIHSPVESSEIDGQRIE